MNAGFSPGLLSLGDDMQRQGGFTGGFRAVNFNNPTAWQAADAGGDVKGDGARRDRRDVHAVVLPQAHDRALAILFFNLRERGIQRFLFIRHSKESLRF